MAYLLRFDGVNDEVTHSEVLFGATSFDVEIDFVPRSISSGYEVVYSNGDGGVSLRHAMYMWGGSRAEIAFIIGGTRRLLNSPVSTFTAGVRYKVNAVYDGSTLQMLVNGVSVASIAATGTVGGSRGLNRIGANTTEARAKIDLYGYKITANGALTRFYDPSNTSSGTVLPETVNNQNGTLVNFTVPDCWVFYSSGATYQLTAQGGTFTYSGQTAALNRGFKLDAQGGTHSYTGASANLSYTTAIIYRLDALGASYSYVGASTSLLRGFVLGAQGGAYSYAGSDALLRRGFKLAANGGAYNYAGADASLTYVAGPTVYRLTALGVTYVYSGAAATLTATGVAPAANPNAFHITARVAGPQHISAMVGGYMTINARIGGSMKITARVS